MPSPKRPETQKHEGSQQLPITELNRTVHEGPQVDTPARAPVSSDLERSDQCPLSQNTPRPSDIAENNPPRQSTPENVEEDTTAHVTRDSAQEESQGLEDGVQDEGLSIALSPDTPNVPKYLYPIMDFKDFKERYNADDFHLARAATRQHRSVKVCIPNYIPHPPPNESTVQPMSKGTQTRLLRS